MNVSSDTQRALQRGMSKSLNVSLLLFHSSIPSTISFHISQAAAETKHKHALITHVYSPQKMAAKSRGSQFNMVFYIHVYIKVDIIEDQCYLLTLMIQLYKGRVCYS